MELIKDFFFQVSILVMPLLIYQMYWYGKGEREKRNLYKAAGLLIVTGLCMMFPVESGGGYRHDLRLVPLIFVVLNREYRLGMITTVFIFAVRYFIGGYGMINFYFAFCVNLFPALALSKIFYKFSFQRKIIAAVIVSAWVPICYGLTHLFIWHDFYIAYGTEGGYIEFLLFHALGMSMVQFIVESMKENDRIKNEMIKLEKISILSHLAASVAHEVRNPLTVVRGFIQLSSKLPDQINQKYMETALQELDHAEVIISDYLTFAKPEGEKMGIFSAGNELYRLVAILNSFATLHNVEFIAHIEDDVCVYGDAGKFKQAMMNFVKNGIESMPNGGVLHVILTRGDQNAVIVIRDEGIGMTPEQVKRLGMPYFSNKQKGTGLGMTVSYRIIESMKGTIDVESVVGKGTCFTIMIPLVKQITES